MNWYKLFLESSNHDTDLLKEYGYEEDRILLDRHEKADQKFQERKDNDIEKKYNRQKRKPTEKPKKFLSIRFNENHLNQVLDYVSKQVYIPYIEYFYDGDLSRYAFKGEEYQKLCDQYRIVEQKSGQGRGAAITRLKQLILNQKKK